MPAFSTLRTWSHCAWLALCLAACQDGTSAGDPEANCPPDTTAIAAIQGEEFRSPLEGQQHTVLGIATLSREDGLYIESIRPDDSARSSEGLFLADPRLAGTPPGSLVVASGTVRELFDTRDTLTALADITAINTCGSSSPLPSQNAELPLPAAARESLEGMRLLLQQPLVVTDVYRLAQGQLQLSAEHILPVPTEVARPGNDAREQMRSNREHSLYVQLPARPDSAFPVGSQLPPLPGVLGNTGRGAVMLAEAIPAVTPPRLFAIQGPEAADLRLLSLNLHNYFNGDGEGGGFPTERGAQTAQAFAAQRARIAAIVQQAQPHLLAVMELENDGFDETSAMADLLDDLAGVTGGQWLAAIPEQERIGSDAITTGLAYRPEALQPLGPALVLDAAPFDLLSRPPLAQRFRERASGTDFWVIVNHFKSKGSCPEQGRDADQGDGQGCWNPARTLAARALAAWAAQLAAEAGDRVLLLGDLNAYRMEDPVRLLVESGYADLTASVGMVQEYSYVYQGEAGTLDYALASPALAALVRRTEILHVNAAWPPGMDLPQDWLGASDHDPVLVDLRLRR